MKICRTNFVMLGKLNCMISNETYIITCSVNVGKLFYQKLWHKEISSAISYKQAPLGYASSDFFFCIIVVFEFSKKDLMVS